MAGAPIGNKNGKKENRWWSETLRRALAQSDAQLMRKCADALIAKAAEGDVPALRELGDRIDGKAMQSLDVQGDIGLTVLLQQADDTA